MQKGLKITVIFIMLLMAFFYWRDQSRRYHHILQENQTADFLDVSKLNIGTYNIKSLNNGKSLNDLITELKNMNLDIVCLEEVDQKKLAF